MRQKGRSSSLRLGSEGWVVNREGGRSRVVSERKGGELKCEEVAQ